MISKVLPYACITTGVLLVLIAPLSFYSNKNLVVPNFHIAPIEKEAPVVGGDIAINSSAINRPMAPVLKSKISFTDKLTAKSVLVIDDKTKHVLYEKNSFEARPLASITKLMTAMVLMDLPINWSNTTTIIETDGNSDELANEGEIFTLDELWHLALVGSSNKAVNALVRVSGLTSGDFIKKMNVKAQDLHLSSLRFVEPTGLSAYNTGNAVDIAELLREALRFDKIYITLRIGEYYAKPLNKEKMRRVWSTDWLLTNWIPNDFNKKDIAGKTGYISESRYNFVVNLADKRQHKIIVAVLGSESNESRFNEARDLAKWIFENYLWPDDERYNELVE